MINKLIILANNLDGMGLAKEADSLDGMIMKYSGELGEVSRKMDAELNIDLILERDRRIDYLTKLVEERYEVGDRLQIYLERIDSTLAEGSSVESQFPPDYLENLKEETVQALNKLSREVDEINEELSSLAFHQGGLKRELRGLSGFLGSSTNPYDMSGDVFEIEQKLRGGEPFPSWSLKNINEPEDLDIAEAKRLSSFMIKNSKATGRISALKILLQDILRGRGYTVGGPEDPENIRDDGSEKIIDIPLDVMSNSWGNTNQAWFAFANHVLRMPEIATDWQSIAPTIGTGYSDGMDGMMDLLRDFKSGGREQVGVDLYSEDIAEQTETLQQNITTQRERHEFDKENIINPEGTHRLADAIRFDSERERLEEEARIADRERAAQEARLLAQNEVDSGSGDVAHLGPAETTWRHAGWTQVRSPDGTVAYYVDDRMSARGMDPKDVPSGQGRMDDLGDRASGPGGKTMANIGEIPYSERTGAIPGQHIEWQQEERAGVGGTGDVARTENPLSDHMVMALSDEFSNNSFKQVNRG